MFRFKGTIIRPNMKTQSWYIERVHTLWDSILFAMVLTLKFMYKPLADVKKYCALLWLSVVNWLSTMQVMSNINIKIRIIILKTH